MSLVQRSARAEKGMASLLFSLALAISMVPVAAIAAPQDADDGLGAQAASTKEMHRLYNPNSGEHFYTASANERDGLKKVGWRYEGVGWTAPGKSETPVYRLYSGTDHHYTTSAKERDALRKSGWKYEGVGWYSDDAKGVPLYRQFNPNVDPAAPRNNSGSHNYTTSKKENDGLVKAGWKAEGIGWYGVKGSSGNSGSTSSGSASAKPGSSGSSGSSSSGSSSSGSSSSTVPDSQQAVNEVKKYTYSIKPVNGKLNNFFFVETNNPNPDSFEFVDTSSKYLENGSQTVIRAVSGTYEDVVYTDKSKRRIANKGYIFSGYNSDGGKLQVKAFSGGASHDTGITVNCPALEDNVDYLIRTYASGTNDLFAKLFAVEQGLESIALYPKSLEDTNRPNTSSYPRLASSPYPELGLNKHIENMYMGGGSLLINNVYGFVLDSAGFPSTMRMVAQRLQPNCTVTSGGEHSLIRVSYGGRSELYGGKGTGSTYPLYSKFVEKTFRFDGTDTGYGTNLSISTLRAKRLEYASKSDAFAEAALAKLSDASVSKVVGDGAWISIAREGSSSKELAYAGYAPDGTVQYASNAWVDGRYVNANERYEPGAKYSDHPKADIILHGVTYVDQYGRSHTTTVTYKYDVIEDMWLGFYYYSGSNSFSWSDANKVSASLILTRKQVEDMVKAGKIDGNTSKAPAAKYIYDGSAEPGTPRK